MGMIAIGVATLGIGGRATAAVEEMAPLPPAAASASPAASAAKLVAFEALAALLPSPPEGWSAEKPEGAMSDSDDLRLTTAERIYWKGEEGEPNAATAAVTIIDFGGDEAYREAIQAGWRAQAQSEAEGPGTTAEREATADRMVEIDGWRGFEHRAETEPACSLSVIVGGRFSVQVALTGLPPEALRGWLKRIDLQKLAGLR